jgi:AcrR family transcriptional regulator
MERRLSDKLTAEERRRRILDAGLECFSQKGFRGTTTKEIAEAAGCSEATIFQHFASKAVLYGAVLEAKTEVEEILAKAADAAARKDDAGVLRAIGIGYLTRTEHDSSLMRLFIYSALEGNERAGRFFRSRVTRVHEFLSSYLQERITEGVFRPVDPLVTARAFVGMVVYYLLLHEIFGVKRPPGISSEQVIDTLVTLFLEGITERGGSGQEVRKASTPSPAPLHHRGRGGR